MLFSLTSGRVQKFGERITRLNKYVDGIGIPSKKPQQLRNELFTSSSTLKDGQIHRNTSEVGSQKFEDRPKNVGLNKRLRTSTTETRVRKNRTYTFHLPSSVILRSYFLFNE